MSLTPREIPTGAVRFNTDSSKMEVYIGDTWMQVAVSSPNLDGGVRGLFGGGATPSNSDVIDFITISTTGDATDFGNLLDSKGAHSGCGNETRGLFGGGNPETSSNKTDGIEFITIASTGNGVDFGNLNAATASLCGTASPTRGLFMGGYTPTTLNTIQFVTVASTGNTQDFGDLTEVRQEAAAFANATRAICAGGGPASAAQGSIDFFTIATLGNASNFGDLITDMQSGMGATSSPTRGVVTTGTGVTNIIEYVEIRTSGDTVDFGE